MLQKETVTEDPNFRDASYNKSRALIAAMKDFTLYCNRDSNWLLPKYRGLEYKVTSLKVVGWQGSKIKVGYRVTGLYTSVKKMGAWGGGSSAITKGMEQNRFVSVKSEDWLEKIN